MVKSNAQKRGTLCRISMAGVDEINKLKGV